MKISFNRRRLYAIEKINQINNISVGNPTGAFYLFVDVSEYCNGNYKGIKSSIDFCNWLLDKYFIAFVPGEVFGVPGYIPSRQCRHVVVHEFSLAHLVK